MDVKSLYFAIKADDVNGIQQETLLPERIDMQLELVDPPDQLRDRPNALMVAAYFHSTSVFELLIAHGANLSSTDTFGVSFHLNAHSFILQL